MEVYSVKKKSNPHRMRALTLIAYRGIMTSLTWGSMLLRHTMDIKEK